MTDSHRTSDTLVYRLRKEHSHGLSDDAADEIERLRAIELAAAALIADVRRRYPGEALRCPYMITLDEALQHGKRASYIGQKPLSEYVSDVAQLLGFDEEVPLHIVRHIRLHEQDGHSINRAVRETKTWLAL